MHVQFGTSQLPSFLTPQKNTRNISFIHPKKSMSRDFSQPFFPTTNKHSGTFQTLQCNKIDWNQFIFLCLGSFIFRFILWTTLLEKASEKAFLWLSSLASIIDRLELLWKLENAFSNSKAHCNQLNCSGGYFPSRFNYLIICFLFLQSQNAFLKCSTRPNADASDDRV